MLLCIDASYLLFYRINALKSWHKHRTKENPTDTELLSDEFKQKLCKMLNTCIVKLCKEHKPSQILFAYDGHKNWRKQVDGQYKSTRTYQKSVLQLFQYGVSCLKDMEFMCCPSAHMEHEALEADDLIHYVVRQRNDMTLHEQPLSTTIIANDYDYLPLLHYPSSVKIVNLKKKTLTLPVGVSGEQYLLMKIIMGDKSDNIPPVLKGYGTVRTTRLVTHETEFQDKIIHGDETIQQRFQQNQILIDNRMVPKQYKKWMQKHLEPFWLP